MNGPDFSIAAARGRLCRIMVATASEEDQAYIVERVREAIEEAVADDAVANFPIIYNASLIFWKVVQPSLHNGDWAALLPVAVLVADGMVRTGQQREWAAQLAVTAAKAQEVGGDAQGASATLESA